MGKSIEDLEREKRKDDHVKLALEGQTAKKSDFDHIRFVHHSLPESSVSEVSLQAGTEELPLESPIYINGMTGGSEMTGKINAQIAEVASSLGMAMGVGSQHAALRNDNVSDTYKIVRKNNPNGIVFANVGADAPLDFAKRAVDMVEANALQIHVNVPQELVMPEGGRDFTGWLKSIEQIVKEVPVPVIIKEVGFGMSKEAITALQEVGVRYIDVSGNGGTNFIWIENERRIKKEYDYINNWGQSTPISLLEASSLIDQVNIFASGGIRNPLDIVKSLALGAKAVGMAGNVLKMIQNEGIEGAIEELQGWHEQIKVILTMLGARNISELANCPLIIQGEVREWCELRGIDVKGYARRSRG